MKSRKKIVVAIFIILFLLLITGVVFAYIYIETDILKSDKQLFFQYFAQITEEDEFIDKRITTVNENKKQQPYENSGEITVDVENTVDFESTDKSALKIIDKVNDLSIKFSGKVDSPNQKVEQNIKIDYGNNVVFPINYKQDSNKYGLQTDKLSSKYIAVRYEKLDELVGEFDGNSIASISQKISTIIGSIFDVSEKMSERKELSEDEKQQLKNIYNPILEKELLDDNFSKLKLEGNESYTLELTNTQVKNIITKILNATKENNVFFTEKINKVVLSQNSGIEKINVSDFDLIVDDLLKNIESTEMPNLKITLAQSGKKLNQILVQVNDTEISINKTKTNDNISYNINCDIKDNESENLSSSNPLNLYLDIEYSGLENAVNIQEKYEMGIGIPIEGKKLGYNYKIKSDIKFTDSISIDKLDKNVAMFLNDYDESQVATFLSQVVTKILEVNKKQMEQLGLKENENPLIYSNPTTLLAYEIYKKANETIEDNNLSEYEKQMFNEKFTRYATPNASGADVNAMLATITSHNLSDVEGDRMVKATLDGVEITDSKVSTGGRYTVEAIYDENGCVSEMKISTNN